MKKKEKISIIGQCYNEEVMIPIYYKAMNELMKKMDYVDFELIFIDDASKDKSLDIIKDLCKKDDRIRFISMSRNFGREACAMAGFKASTGDYVTTMDLDLQDPPELLIQMYNAIKNENVDIAAAKALTRKGYSFFHKLCTNAFFKITNSISSVKMVDGQREYRLMTRQVVDSILEFKEYNLFNKGLLNDVGFKVKWIEFENVERAAGDTKFPYKRMIKYAITGILDYSTFPLSMILYSGIFFMFISLVLLILVIIGVTSTELGTLALIMALFSSLITGIILLSNGIMSLYLSQMHLEVKHRPLYIIKETEINKK